MQNNGDMPASPQSAAIGPDGEAYDSSSRGGSGLTKREQFAAMAMQGILSSQYYSDYAAEFTANVNPRGDKASGAAKAALAHADALLQELAK